ncbi:MAG: acyl-CoA/acyl-ACP dehydrogenase [Acidobacteriota bacterium]|nr:acyl-CoA/acyl-ACP dehydrogenase [Acidobacteriota bacterium]
MELGLSDTQEMFLDATCKLLDERSGPARLRELVNDPLGFDRPTWEQGGRLGWYAMFVPEKYGGGSVSGAAVPDAAMVSEAMGSRLHTGPFLATNVVAFALAEAAGADLQERFLPGLADGSLVGTWAVADRDGDWSASSVGLVAHPDGDGFRLEGTKSYVHDAASADLFLVNARTPEGPIQVVVAAHAPGITITPLDSLDLGRRLAEVHFSGTPVSRPDVVGEGEAATRAIERQLQVALVLQCAETNGVTQTALDMTVGYAKERVAFGRPIGSYQALKHRLADHRMWLEGSFATTAYAATSVQQARPDAAVAARIAKSHVGRWSTHTLHDCIQIHGGIGMTWEYDLHLYFRRAISNEMLYGAPYDHMRQLVDLVEGNGR